MTHIWLRAETRADEMRCPLTPHGAATLIKQGIRLSVEDMSDRIFPTDAYRDAGCEIVEAEHWPSAPKDAFILGLKELPHNNSPLIHRHIMFGHAFKGQHSGLRLLRQFKAGGGALLDLEHLMDDTGRRVAAFGYWAGFAGAAVTLMAWAAQQQGKICPAVTAYPNQDAMLADIRSKLDQLEKTRPTAIIVGALGRVGGGVADLCTAYGVNCTKWDLEETASGGSFSEILQHDLFFNCVLAKANTPIFVPLSACTAVRQLTMIGDISCDPDSDYNPVPLYSKATDWSCPVVRVAEELPLDVMAIDNLPSLLPRESSEDFAEQLLPHLQNLHKASDPIWQSAAEVFEHHINALGKDHT